jgi:hypothetical protein
MWRALGLSLEKGPWGGRKGGKEGELSRDAYSPVPLFLLSVTVGFCVWSDEVYCVSRRISEPTAYLPADSRIFAKQ